MKSNVGYSTLGKAFEAGKGELAELIAWFNDRFKSSKQNSPSKAKNTSKKQ